MTPGKHYLNSSCRQNGWELSFPSNNFQELGALVLHQFERVKRHLKNQFATSITGVGCKYWKHITLKSFPFKSFEFTVFKASNVFFTYNIQGLLKYVISKVWSRHFPVIPKPGKVLLQTHKLIKLNFLLTNTDNYHGQGIPTIQILSQMSYPSYIIFP